MTHSITRLLTLLLPVLLTVPAPAQGQTFKIPPAELKEQIIWGSTCEGLDGLTLGFGGQDQKGDETPRTRIKAGGEWRSLSEELRKNNALQKAHGLAQELVRLRRVELATGRSLYYQGSPRGVALTEQRKLSAAAEARLRSELKEQAGKLKGYDRKQAELALARLPTRKAEADGVDAEVLQRGAVEVTEIVKVAELLDAEPAGRFLSPLTYDPKTRLFLLVAGDHGDYLTSDLWLYDPARKKWEQRHPPAAPAPRAAHTLKANGDGTVTLSGGYTYTSSTDYCGAQYRKLSDGDWTYDIATNTWKGSENGVPADTRVYRTGPFHPDFFLQGDRPDAVAARKELDAIPVNRWVERRPPHKPEMVRTWGHAVLDPDHDMVLVFSGGHSAHCGSDVLHYHLSTNRWELPFPVEFPLGQTYSNTSYPEGFNLNRRPWVTGHTYQSYNYDPGSKRMYLNARMHNTYVYDPAVGDWIGRFPKPKPMVYNGCFYTLNTVPTPHGLLCWIAHGGVFKLDATRQEWQEVKRSGARLPGAVVDSSTLVYDSKRDRLIFFRNDYGKKNDGEALSLDLKSGEVTRKSPSNAAALAALDLKGVDRAVYVPDHDVVLFSALLPGETGKPRRALAYDCAADRWLSLDIGYALEKGKRVAHPGGPGHSCGLLFDAKRKLIWGIDTHDCRVYALRLELKTAGPQRLGD